MVAGKIVVFMFLGVFSGVVGVCFGFFVVVVWLFGVVGGVCVWVFGLFLMFFCGVFWFWWCICGVVGRGFSLRLD